jgi:cytosine/adenosine deaminase-related metal-dependent hydrolase
MAMTAIDQSRLEAFMGQAVVDLGAAFSAPLVRLGVSPHAPYTVSDELYQAATRFALDEQLPMALHVAEAEVECLLVEQGSGQFADGLRSRGISVHPRAKSSLALLDRLGVLEARPLLIHCVRLADGDVERIAASGSTVAHCPSANAKLGHGIAPIRDLLDAGVPVGLGSDSVASSNRMDLLEEARLAALLQGARLLRHDALLRLARAARPSTRRTERDRGRRPPGT